MAKTSVAVKEEDKLPAFMQEHVGLGSENLGAGDSEVPRLKLMQALSPELEENNGLKQGEFWHTLAEENFGTSVRVTPIWTDCRYILWRPRDAGGGILARADDGRTWSPADTEFTIKLKSGQEVKWKTAKTVVQSGLDKWGSYNPADPNSPPAATRMYNFVMSFPDRPDLPPAVVTLQRAAIRVARKLIGKLKVTQAPSFGLIFEMTSFKDRNSAGQDFYNYAFKMNGKIMDQDLYKSNYAQYKFFKEQGLQVKDIEGAQDEEVPADEGKF